MWDQFCLYCVRRHGGEESRWGIQAKGKYALCRFQKGLLVVQNIQEGWPDIFGPMAWQFGLAE